jgi:general secretion pathway protein L
VHVRFREPEVSHVRLLDSWKRVHGAAAPWLDWWLAELRDIAGQVLDRVWPAARALAVLHVGSESPKIIHRQGDHLLEAEPPRGIRTIVVCPDSAVLTKRLHLPAAARRRLRNILELAIEREMPLHADAAYFDYAIVSSDANSGMLEVELAMARRARIEEWLASARERGLQPIGIGLQQPSDWRLRFNFLPAIRSARSASMHRWDRPLTIAAAVLCAVMAATTVWQWRAERNYAESELARLAETAKSAAHARSDLVSQLDVMKAFESQMQVPTTGGLIAELTRVVPANSWIHELRFQRGEIRLAGTTTDAATLASSIEKSPAFERVMLISTVPAGLGTGQDRVEMTLRPSEETQ